MNFNYSCSRKSKKIVVKQPREPSYLEILPPRPSDYSTAPQDQDFSTPRPDVADHVYSMPNDPNSRSVSSEYFEEYAKKAAESGLLMMQFMVGNSPFYGNSGILIGIIHLIPFFSRCPRV